jgi:nitroreductase
VELIEGIETRRSYRGFKSNPIPGETLEAILKSASRSPSYTNTQPWEVAVVCGKKRDELSAMLYRLADSNAASSPDIPSPTGWPPEMEKRSKEHGARRMTALGVERDDKEMRRKLRMMNYEFYGAPSCIFLFMDKSLTDWSLFDVGLFAQTLCLAAHAHGLGTCLQASTVSYPDAIREFLNIHNTKKLVIGISIGYPDPEAPINSYHSLRANIGEFVSWHK